MAIGWLTVLQAVPWSEVINNAPKVAEGARKLWSTVAKKPPETAAPPADVQPFSTASSQAQVLEVLALLETRLAAAEASASQMHEQLLASSELIQALAEQNAQFISRIESNRVKVKWLTAVAMVAAVAGFTGLGLALAQRLA